MGWSDRVAERCRNDGHAKADPPAAIADQVAFTCTRCGHIERTDHTRKAVATVKPETCPNDGAWKAHTKPVSIDCERDQRRR